jgi:hypothetical protein
VAELITAIDMSILFLTVFVVSSLIILEFKQPIARLKSQKVAVRSKANTQQSNGHRGYNVTYIPVKLKDAHF